MKLEFKNDVLGLIHVVRGAEKICTIRTHESTPTVLFTGVHVLEPSDFEEIARFIGSLS